MANAPVATFTEGFTKATLWTNESEKDGEKIFFDTATLARIYRDEDAEHKWSETNSGFSLHDLQNLQLVIGDAIQKIRELRAARK